MKFKKNIHLFQILIIIKNYLKFCKIIKYNLIMRIKIIIWSIKIKKLILNIKLRVSFQNHLKAL